MRNLVAAVMAGGVMLLGAGGALAQETDELGMDCVYNALAEDYDLVAEVYLFNDVSDEDIAAVNQIVETAKKGCAERYPYSEGQLMTVGELGVYAVAIDYIAEELLYLGVSDQAIEGVLDVYDGLSDDDAAMFYDDTWMSNTPFYTRMKDAVIAKGIPANDEALGYAMGILEISALAEDAAMLFHLDDLLAEDEEL